MGHALKIEDLPHYTYSDYRQWEGKWELILGVPYAMSPSPEFYHQDINVNIVSYLKTQVNLCPGCVAVMSFDWKISDDTVIQPDALVTCGKYNQNFIEEAPEIVFEILSPSTRYKDRNIKYDIYQAENVKYYVIIDPKIKTITVFQLENDSYSSAGEFQNETFKFSISRCSFDFDFSKIW